MTELEDIVAKYSPGPGGNIEVHDPKCPVVNEAIILASECRRLQASSTAWESDALLRDRNAHDWQERVAKAEQEILSRDAEIKVKDEKIKELERKILAQG